MDELLDAFDARLPDAATFAMQNRVLLLRSPSGVGIDVALGALPFEERAVGRARLPLLELKEAAADRDHLISLLRGFPDDER